MTELSADDHAVLPDIRDRTRCILRDALVGARDVAILDVPNQRNSGDSLIFAGELSYLRDLGVRVRYLADIEPFDSRAIRAQMPTGTILMHGGGNFGDIWFGHQVHRERIARQFPDYPIVMLPQSVLFRSDERAAAANAALAKHPQLQLLVRDEASLARARRSLPDVTSRFCPDAALGLTLRPLPTAPHSHLVLALARADRESASGLAEVTDGWLEGAMLRRTDWEPTGPGRWTWALARRYLGRGQRWNKTRFGRTIDAHLVAFCLRHINNVNVRSARRLFRGVRLAVVDRLHAHILAALLGVPHIVLDNTYGKIGAVMGEYTGAFQTAYFADDLGRARALAVRELAEL